jgi:hypothetical protein
MSLLQRKNRLWYMVDTEIAHYGVEGGIGIGQSLGVSFIERNGRGFAAGDVQHRVREIQAVHHCTAQRGAPCRSPGAATHVQQALARRDATESRSAGMYSVVARAKDAS